MPVKSINIIARVLHTLFH